MPSLRGICLKLETSIHRAAEKGYSRKPSFRYTGFSETNFRQCRFSETGLRAYKRPETPFPAYLVPGNSEGG